MFRYVIIVILLICISLLSTAQIPENFQKAGIYNMLYFSKHSFENSAFVIQKKYNTLTDLQKTAMKRSYSKALTAYNELYLKQNKFIEEHLQNDLENLSLKYYMRCNKELGKNGSSGLSGKATNSDLSSFIQSLKTIQILHNRNYDVLIQVLMDLDNMVSEEVAMSMSLKIINNQLDSIVETNNVYKKDKEVLISKGLDLMKNLKLQEFRAIVISE